MRYRVYRFGMLATLAMLLVLGMVLVGSSYSEVGVVCEAGAEGLPLQVQDYSVIPPSVIDDATKVAASLFDNSREDGDKFVSQVLALYSEAKDKDFVMIFNPGGWGEGLLENAAGWQSIVAGVQSELSSLGYKWLSLDYIRTGKSWGERLAEMREMMELYPTKARDLASRVEFLTRNLPHLRVILTGESTGSVISDTVMSLLPGNQQVFSIQAGPPFWHKTLIQDRILVLTDNGIVPDSFSRGDFLTIIASNVRTLFRLPQPVDAGNIFYIVRAPGHAYWWQYPNVYSQISRFLEQNFGIGGNS